MPRAAGIPSSLCPAGVSQLKCHLLRDVFPDFSGFTKSDPSFLCTIFLHSTHFMTLFPVFFVSLFTVCLSSYTISNREVETTSIVFTLVSPALFQEYSDLIMRVCLMHAL